MKNKHLTRTYGKNGLPELPAQPDPAPVAYPCCATEREDGDCCCTADCPIGGTGLPEPTPLHRALIQAMVGATNWRE
jgi:hypothetical protein